MGKCKPNAKSASKLPVLNIPPSSPDTQPFSIHLNPRTARQRQVVNSWPHTRILFLLGPAGVGKDYLALGLAIRDMLHASWNRQPKLTLTRPMVSCDEEFGFLPGDINEKLEPWLAPFKDVLFDLSNGKWDAMRKAIDVEFVPTGLLRGRTISNGIIIADEMQNATTSQVKCLLTRIGRDGRIIICADPEQSDRFDDPYQVPIAQAAANLEGLAGISVMRFDEGDIVRDPLISQMLARL